MTNKRYAIEAKGIHKSFGKLEVLKGVDLKVERGSVLALLGPNGAGKTTMVRILSTLLRADKGRVSIEGLDVVKDAHEVRSLIGLTGQYAAIDEYLSGRENLKMMGRLYHLSHEDTARRTEELLGQFDLLDAAGRYAKTYSGGMRRRLDLAASLIAMPPIIFLDEPTTGLDPRSRIAMWNIIQDLVRGGTTILLTTQQLEEADRLADEIAVIDDGNIIARGTADELKSKVGGERILFYFETSKDFNKAAKFIGKDILHSDERQKSLSVTNDKGVSKLRKLLGEFEESKIEVSGAQLSKPTLDDVFLTLTGRKASNHKSNADNSHNPKESKV